MTAIFRCRFSRPRAAAFQLRRQATYIDWELFPAQISLEPEVESSTIGRSISSRSSISAGLLFKWKPKGILPPNSPTSNGFESSSASATAASRVGTGKHFRPRATAVATTVVALITSTAMIASSSWWDSTLSGKQSITTAFTSAGAISLYSSSCGAGWAKVRFFERVRVQTATIDFNPQQLIQAHVAQAHLVAEVFQQCELAGFVGRLEGRNLKTEFLRKTIRERRVERAVGTEKAHSGGAFARFHNQLHRPGVQPGVSPRNRVFKRFFTEGPLVFLSHLILHFEATFLRQLEDLLRLAVQVCESLAAFDARNADVRAQVQVGFELPLGDSNLEGSASCAGWHPMGAGCCDLAARRPFVG